MLFVTGWCKSNSWKTSAMSDEPSRRARFWRNLLLPLAIVIPAFVIYDILFQLRTPTLDIFLTALDSPLVTQVVPGGAAEAAGLRPGDTLLRVDGVSIAGWHASQLGQTHTVEIERAGQRLALKMPDVPLIRVSGLSLLSAIIVALTFWGVGTLLLWRRYGQLDARLFFLMTQSIGMGLLFFLAHPQIWSLPDWMSRLRSVGFHAAGAILVHYYLTFPVSLGSLRQRRVTLSLLYGLMLVALACRLTFTPLGTQLSFVYNTLEIVAAIIILIYAYLRRATPDGRRRLRLVVVGSLAAVIPPFFFYLLPIVAGSAIWMPDWRIGPFIIIAPLSYLYAIVRHNLFGIDRLLNRTLVYAILSIGILLLYLGPLWLIYRWLPNDLLAEIVVITVLTLLVGLSFDWTRTRVQRWVDRLFYGGWYDYPGVVESISGALAHCTDRKQLNEVLTRQVPALMQLKEGQLWIGESAAMPQLRAALPQLRFPLYFQERVRAQWAVGPRRDGEDFTTADRRILKTLARQAETALGNALLIETLHDQLEEVRASRATLAQAQRRLLHSREAERARLARDLHDGPLQILVGLNLQTGLLLSQMSEADDGLVSALKDMRVEVQSLLNDLRQVCAELRPPMLDTLGLGATLRALAQEWSAQNNIAVQLELLADDALRTLPGDIAVNLYRVAQEALTNVARHAQAQHVIIRLSSEADQLTMTLHDDGHGFVPADSLQASAAQGHFGLIGMRERIDLIGGQLTLDSSLDRGTVVHVTWRRPDQPIT
jgi:signal transduction histidine kinase